LRTKTTAQRDGSSVLLALAKKLTESDMTKWENIKKFMGMDKKETMNEALNEEKNIHSEKEEKLKETEALQEIMNELNASEAETKQGDNAAAESVAETTKIQAELEKLRAEKEELNDKYLRLFAEFQNYKRRTAKERLELQQMAGRDVIKALLPVLDDFNRAKKAADAPDSTETFSEGVALVYEKLNRTMAQQGLKVLESNGQSFDPDLHEAITEIPAPSEDMKGKVFDTVENGYTLNDKIIRYAKVVVAK
jgi:molecular chaperone GrpE